MAPGGVHSRRVVVSEGVFLYCEQRRAPPPRRGPHAAQGTELRYDLECSRFSRARFTLVLSGARNVAAEAAEGTELQCEGTESDAAQGAPSEVRLTRTVQPFRRERIGVVRSRDVAEKTSFKTSFRWELLAPDVEEVQRLVRENEAQLARHVLAAAGLGFGDDSASVAEMERRCIMHGVRFLDADFPPGRESLFGSHEGDAVQLVWRRPEAAHDSSTAEVFVAGVEPGDIRQGALADCWFLCALSSLAEFEPLIRRLFFQESRTRSAHGVYKMRFCKNGEWQAVMVDDLLPCFPGGGPAYSKGHGGELWVSLLEKAYAKLHGSYAAIRMGWAFEAMIDLTGAPFRTVHLEDLRGTDAAESQRLWESLLRWDAQGFVMSVSTSGEDTFTETGARPPKDGSGLVRGHAYTLLEAKETRQGHRLVLIRNPWGNFEWTGDWSDHSPLWTDALRKEVGAVLDDQDGTFWMSFEDMLRRFFSFNVCMVKHRGGESPPWKEMRRKVRFRYSGADGSVTASSIYVLSISEATRLFASIHQEDIRCANARPYLDVGVTIMRIRNDYTYDLAGSCGNTAERQTQTDEIFLGPGEYLVLPTSTGCKFRQGVQDALQNRNAPAAPLWMPGAEGRRFSERAAFALNSIFRAMDEDLDGLLKREELRNFMQTNEAHSMSNEVFDWLLATFDSVDDGLTPDGLRQCYAYMWEQSGRNDEVVWKDLAFHGYHRSLELLYSRSAVLAFHADAAFTLHARPFDALVYEEAMELPIKMLGECKFFEDAGIRLHIRKGGYSGVSLAAENVSDADVLFSLDMSRSVNATTHRESLSHTERIPRGETKVMHHIMPRDADKAWRWEYSPEVQRITLPNASS